MPLYHCSIAGLAAHGNVPDPCAPKKKLVLKGIGHESHMEDESLETELLYPNGGKLRQGQCRRAVLEKSAPESLQTFVGSIGWLDFESPPYRELSPTFSGFA